MESFIDDNQEVQHRSEIERRKKYIDALEKENGWLNPGLIHLIKQCLYNAPHQRPSTDELLVRLQVMRVIQEGENVNQHQVHILCHGLALSW